MEPSTKLREKLQAFRAKLLDLSGRNQMLNFRLSKSQGVEFDVTDIAEKLDELMKPENLCFEIVAEKPTNGMAIDEETLGEVEEWIPPMQSMHFESIYSQRELTKRLTQSYRKHKEAIDNRGVNILGLATAFLSCPRQTVSGFSRTETWTMPLLLIRLQADQHKDKRGRRHIILKSDNEIMVNPAAIKYLADELTPGIQLPELKENNLEDVQTESTAMLSHNIVRWLDAVAGLVPTNDQRWYLDRERIAVSASFTFHKFPMYEDLNADLWGNVLDTNPLILQLLGMLQPEEPSSSDEEHRELEASEGLFTVLDADSSQLAAILEAAAGKNLIIHGPPGTGKSQTITNLIAQLLAQNKQILFVAEKRAALEVVAANLRKVGLSNAFLDLHHNQMEPKIFRDRLKQVWNLEPTARADNAFLENLHVLKRTRKALDAYYQAANQLIGNANLNFRDAVGGLALIDEAFIGLEVRSTKITNFGDWTTEAYRERCEFLDDASAIFKRVGKVSDTAFARYWPDLSSMPIAQNRIHETINTFLQGIVKIQAIHSQNDISLATTLNSTHRLIWLAQVLDEKLLSEVKLDDPRWVSQGTQLDDLVNKVGSLNSLQKMVAKDFQPDVFEADLESINNDFRIHGNTWLKRFNPEYRLAVVRFEKLYRTGIAPTKRHADRIRLIGELVDLQSKIFLFNKESLLGSELFQANWAGLQTNVDVANKAREQIKIIGEAAQLFSVTQITMLNEVNRIKPIMAEYTSVLNDVIRKGLKPTIDLLVPKQIMCKKYGEMLIGLQLDELYNEVSAYQARSLELEDLTVLKHKEHQAIENSLGSLFEKALTSPAIAEHLTLALRYLWHDYHIQHARSHFPILNESFGSSLSQAQLHFSSYDKKFLEGNRERIKAIHAENVQQVKALTSLASDNFFNGLFNLTRFQASRRPRAILHDHLDVVKGLSWFI